MKTRTIILPLILIGCMLTAAGAALLSPPTEVEAEPVVKKQAERIMKNPVTVEEMEGRNKKEESRNIEVAEAVIATITPTPTAEPSPSPTPEITPEPVATEEPILVMEDANDYVEAVNDYEEPPVVAEEPVYEEPPVYVDAETQEEMPAPADEFAYSGMIPLGGYTVTWYSADMVGYDAPGASGNGLTPYYSCAMPDYGLLNCTIYVENYGFFHVDDVSPGGICDLFVNSVSEIPSYGQDYQMVYLVG